MAKLARTDTERPPADADRAQSSDETQGVMEQGTSEAPQKSSGMIAETQPAPRFTPQDYGLLLALIAAFVILIISLAKRRGG